MDLVGYFGFPSHEHPEESAVPSRAQKRSKKHGSKRLSGASSRRNKFAPIDSKKSCDNSGDLQVSSEEESKPNESSIRARIERRLEHITETDLFDEKLEEFNNEPSSSFAEKNTSQIKKQREDCHLQKRRKLNQSAFTIRSALYGQPQQLSHQQISSRLRMGKGTSNILSHLFRRSMQPCSLKTSSMTSYVHSGQHWNISQTVQLDTTRNSGEVSAMSFDEEGVLLAMGDDRGFVRIYDFDDVNSLDIGKRNEMSRLRAKTDNEIDLNEGASSPLHEVAESELNVSEEKMKALPPPVEPALSKPALSFRSASYRITNLQWNPNNQDQLAVSFAQSPEVHLYDVASSKTPLPKLTIGTLNNPSTKGREGVSVIRFLKSESPKKKTTQILTAGSRGTVGLWWVPEPKRRQSISDINARCIWSVDVSESGGEGCSDLVVLPSANSTDKPLVLISGCAGSLVLLNTGRCTRKSFSASATPTIQSKWDLYTLTARELSKLNNDTKLPARRWMGVHQMSILKYHCAEDISSFRMSLVLNCGWVLVANLSVVRANNLSTNKNSSVSDHNHNYSVSVRIQIVHQTPRVECFNSSNEKMTILSGMALNCSLPDIPIPSSASINRHNQVIWLGDVKPKKYTMPSKDKFVLCEQYGTITTNEVHGEQCQLRHPGEGLMLLDVTSGINELIRGGSSEEPVQDDNSQQSQMTVRSGLHGTLARLPLANGTPSSLALHPTEEWMVVGYGLKGRCAAMRILELVSFRKSLN